jgi:hypothetical protein
MNFHLTILVIGLLVLPGPNVQGRPDQDKIVQTGLKEFRDAAQSGNKVVLIDLIKDFLSEKVNKASEIVEKVHGIMKKEGEDMDKVTKESNGDLDKLKEEWLVHMEDEANEVFYLPILSELLLSYSEDLVLPPPLLSTATDWAMVRANLYYRDDVKSVNLHIFLDDVVTILQYLETIIDLKVYGFVRYFKRLNRVIMRSTNDNREALSEVDNLVKDMVSTSKEIERTMEIFEKVKSSLDTLKGLKVTGQYHRKPGVHFEFDRFAPLTFYL